jgi:hypothetical protein
MGAVRSNDGAETPGIPKIRWEIALNGMDSKECSQGVSEEKKQTILESNSTLTTG